MIDNSNSASVPLVFSHEEMLYKCYQPISNNLWPLNFIVAVMAQRYVEELRALEVLGNQPKTKKHRKYSENEKLAVGDFARNHGVGYTANKFNIPFTNVLAWSRGKALSTKGGQTIFTEREEGMICDLFNLLAKSGEGVRSNRLQDEIKYFIHNDTTKQDQFKYGYPSKL